MIIYEVMKHASVRSDLYVIQYKLLCLDLPVQMPFNPRCNKLPAFQNQTYMSFNNGSSFSKDKK